MFNYQKNSSFIYKIPAYLKILLIIPSSVAISKMPVIFCIVAISALSSLSFLSGFNLKKQLSDIKPIKYYLIFIVIVQIISEISKSGFNLKVFKIETYAIIFTLKLILIMQLCSLLWRSTTPIEIKDGLDLIENKIRVFIRGFPLCKKISVKPAYSQFLSLFLNFIPQIPLLWEKLDSAWTARAGKQGFKKILILFPALFALCFKSAADKNRAMHIRTDSRRQ